jgi:putative membrane protein insertion efficiency factor
MGKKIIFFVIIMYRCFIKPLLSGQCRFHPNCSLYAEIAIEKYGIICGSWLTLRRLLKCHPWSIMEYDPVPELNDK